MSAQQVTVQRNQNNNNNGNNTQNRNRIEYALLETKPPGSALTGEIINLPAALNPAPRIPVENIVVSDTSNDVSHC